MKKLLISIILIASVFCLICCDADSIVKAGEKMHDMRSVNSGYADAVMNLFIHVATSYIDELLYFKPEHYDPKIGNIEKIDLDVLVELVKRAKESSMPKEAIVTEFSKIVYDVPKSEKHNLHLEDVLNNFIKDQSNITDLADQMKAIVPTMADKIDTMLTTQLPKVVQIANNIQPAIHAVQMINDQSCSHDGMSYADIIAKAILYRITYEVIMLLVGLVPSREDFTINIANDLVSYLSILEIVYDVTFDIPEIAGRFVENKITNK